MKTTSKAKKSRHMKTLVVCYSKTGNTKKIGQEIARALDADFEQIIEIGRRKGLIAYFMSGFEALKEKSSRIKPLSRSIYDYKRVIIGTPIWAGNITPALRTFLKINYLKDKKVHLFFTSGSGNTDKADSSIRSLLPMKFSGKILSLKETEVKNKAYDKKLKSFIKGIKNEQA